MERKKNETGVRTVFAEGVTVGGVSFIGDPKDGTALFVTRKMRAKLGNLRGKKGCLVFAEEGLEIPKELGDGNTFVMTADPLGEYGKLALRIAAEEEKAAAERKHTLMPGGYWIGENVTIGEGARIEAGCLIDHDVTIGEGALIGFGSVIRHAKIGKNFRCGEHTSIGAPAYFPSGEGDDAFRIPAFGQVLIGDGMDLGCGVVIERGFNADTVIGNHGMIDAHVCIGHDVRIGDRVRIICGTSLAGLVTVGDDVYIGMNAAVKQRLTIWDGAQIGMGAIGIVNVKAGTKVFGNPASRSE